jgi:pSer/pThr/pTyr-binding forkhead associated (FHA) protein
LGRSEANDLPFPEDDGLSRRHLIFEHDENQWAVIDLGSKNGTYVNGARITGKQSLQPGDQITASCISIQFTTTSQKENW